MLSFCGGLKIFLAIVSGRFGRITSVWGFRLFLLDDQFHALR
jgi:hypothetical protein